MDKKNHPFPFFRKFYTPLKSFFLKYRKTLLYAAAVLPLVISLITYFAINKKDGFQSDSFDYYNRDLIEGINNYRLENYDRAEMLLKRAAEGSKRKKIDSAAFLYLGNIEYQKGNYRGALEYYEESLGYDKKNIYALHNIAESYVKSGKPALTLKYAMKVFELQKGLRPNLLLLGNVYYAAGKYKKALSMYEGLESDDGVFMLNSASAYLKMGSPEKAEQLLKRVIESPGPDDAVKGLSRVKLSDITEKTDRFKAAGYMREALKVFPSSPVLRYNLSLLLFRLMDYEESVRLLRSVEGTLTSGNFDTLLGMALFKSEYLNEALDHYLNMYGKSGAASVAHVIGDIYLKLGDMKKAEIYYLKALQDPENETAYRNLVNIYIKEKRYKEAADLCEGSMMREPENPMPYLCLADVYFHTKRSAEGRRLVDKAAQLSAGDANYLTMAASLYKENNLNNNALQIYYRILSLDPNYYRPYVEIAEIYMEAGHTDRTREFLADAKYKLDDAEKYYQLSLFQAEVETDQKAFEIYNELIRDFPYRYEVYFNMSLKYIDVGKYESAVQTVQKCLNSDIELNVSARSELFTILGAAQQYIGNSGKAAKAFKESLRLDSGNEFSFVNLKAIGN
jgi:tetratricopeptide (TPR) repeat protein